MLFMFFWHISCNSIPGSCTGETNECHNGGTAIWDPVKPYSCQCMDGYEGGFCEKCKTSIHLMVL